jgi:hypothetical protein
MKETVATASGPQVGQLLEAVCEAQAGGQVRTRDEPVEFLRSQRLL